MKDYYAILGIPQDATAEDVKRAFRKLAKVFHPDICGEEIFFKELNEAYTVLFSYKNRRIYDLLHPVEVYRDPLLSKFTNQAFVERNFIIKNKFWIGAAQGTIRMLSITRSLSVTHLSRFGFWSPDHLIIVRGSARNVEEFAEAIDKWT